MSSLTLTGQTWFSLRSDQCVDCQVGRDTGGSASPTIGVHGLQIELQTSDRQADGWCWWCGRLVTAPTHSLNENSQTWLPVVWKLNNCCGDLCIAKGVELCQNIVTIEMWNIKT